MGVITELATAAPGYSSIRPNTCASLAQTLRLNGSVKQRSGAGVVDTWRGAAAMSARADLPRPFNTC
jgi:arylsulfatase